MKEEYKKPWIKALRSGKFKQGEASLYKDGKYCCLGVLCEIVRGRKPLECDRISDGEYLNSFLLVETGLTDKVQQKLAEMNDGTAGKKQRSFNYLATYIEKYV